MTARLDTVADFLAQMDVLEEEITEPEAEDVEQDPTRAGPKDRLEHGLTVKCRLGKGSTALALLVEKSGKEQVLKIALTPNQNSRLRDEAEVLGKLRHQSVVEIHEILEFGDRIGLLLAKAGDRTLAARLRDEGRLHLELLERFGEDLLSVVDWLEQQGIPHRDIKPENFGVAKVGRDDKLHLILFDFSLSRAPAENIHAGTREYLDPFLSERKPPRWDTYAERFAAAVTLYEMATGLRPRWGDGQSAPVVLDCEATLESDAFEPSMREGLTEFFTKALRRDFLERYDNAQEMLRAWRQCFVAASRPEIETDEGEGVETPLERAGLETEVVELGLNSRALSALERTNVSTVEELLRFPLGQLHRMRGVGNSTRRELRGLVATLTKRFPETAREPKQVPVEAAPEVSEDLSSVSVDELLRQVLPSTRTKDGRKDARIVEVFLGSTEKAKPDDWPTQTAVARQVKLSPAPVSQALGRSRRRWLKSSAITQLRVDVSALLDGHGGVMTGRELAEAVLARRGSVQEGDLRLNHATAVVRAAVEAERDLASPRWIVRRPHAGSTVLIARDEVDEQGESRLDGQGLADYAERLARKANELAHQEPLPSPARVLQELQAVKLPAGHDRLLPARIIRLAAATAEKAAISSRLELYPRGLEAKRALRLALGALAGATELTVRDIQVRVAGRYPEAEPLPGRLELDSLLTEVGSELRWEPGAHRGEGAYKTRFRELVTLVSRSSSNRTATEQVSDIEADDDARAFEVRLCESLRERRFLALVSSPRRLLQAERALTTTHAVQRRSFDDLLIRSMRKAAEEARADWSVIIRADAADPGSTDWRNLMGLVLHRALPRVRSELAKGEGTLLLTNLGLLARYDQMDFLGDLRDAAGRRGELPGIWLLVPADRQTKQPLLDGKPIPVFQPAHWARIPGSWLEQHQTEPRRQGGLA